MMRLFAIKITSEKQFTALQKVLMKLGYIWIGRENEPEYKMDWSWFGSNTIYLHFESDKVMNVKNIQFISESELKYTFRAGGYKVLENFNVSSNTYYTKEMLANEMLHYYNLNTQTAERKSSRVVGLGNLVSFDDLSKTKDEEVSDGIRAPAIKIVISVKPIYKRNPIKFVTNNSKIKTKNGRH